jgi:hypothetical protein
MSPAPLTRCRACTRAKRQTPLSATGPTVFGPACRSSVCRSCRDCTGSGGRGVRPSPRVQFRPSCPVPGLSELPGIFAPLSEKGSPPPADFSAPAGILPTCQCESNHNMCPVPVPASRPSPSVPSQSRRPVPVPASRPSPGVPSQSRRPVPVPVSRPSPGVPSQSRCPVPVPVSRPTGHRCLAAVLMSDAAVERRRWRVRARDGRRDGGRPPNPSGPPRSLRECWSAIQNGRTATTPWVLNRRLLDPFYQR